MKGSFYDNPCDGPTVCNERLRDGTNDWIRTSGEFDAVVDLDRALADPVDPDAMHPAYASPDLLHPNDAGVHAMATAIDPSSCNQRTNPGLAGTEPGSVIQNAGSGTGRYLKVAFRYLDVTKATFAYLDVTKATFGAPSANRQPRLARNQF